MLPQFCRSWLRRGERGGPVREEVLSQCWREVTGGTKCQGDGKGKKRGNQGATVQEWAALQCSARRGVAFLTAWECLRLPQRWGGGPRPQSVPPHCLVPAPSHLALATAGPHDRLIIPGPGPAALRSARSWLRCSDKASLPCPLAVPLMRPRPTQQVGGGPDRAACHLASQKDRY